MPSLDALDTYYEQIGAPPAIRVRVADLIAAYPKIYGGQPEFVFLENGLTNDGGKQFTNLCCMTPDKYVAMPVPETNWATAAMSLAGLEGVSFAEIDRFDFQFATEASRLKVVVRRTNTSTLQFTATGKNCHELVRLVRRYFLPKLGA